MHPKVRHLASMLILQRHDNFIIKEIYVNKIVFFFFNQNWIKIVKTVAKMTQSSMKITQIKIFKDYQAEMSDFLRVF